MAKNKEMAAIVWLLSVVGTTLALMSDKKDKFVMAWAKEALAFFLVCIGANVLVSVIAIIPVLGWIIGALLAIVLWPVVLVVYLWGAWQAWQGKNPELPLVHKIAKSIHL